MIGRPACPVPEVAGSASLSRELAGDSPVAARLPRGRRHPAPYAALMRPDFQLELIPLEITPDQRRAWGSQPFRDQRRCTSCGEVTATTGTRRTRQVCLRCFARSLPRS